MIRRATGDSLLISLALYRRLIACFFGGLIAGVSGPLQETVSCFSGPSSLTFSAESVILELKGSEIKFSPCVQCSLWGYTFFYHY